MIDPTGAFMISSTDPVGHAETAWVQALPSAKGQKIFLHARVTKFLSSVRSRIATRTREQLLRRRFFSSSVNIRILSWFDQISVVDEDARIHRHFSNVMLDAQQRRKA